MFYRGRDSTPSPGLYLLTEDEEPTDPQVYTVTMLPLPSPPFLVYVMWHPDCCQAFQVAERIRDHFGTQRFRNAMGGVGIDVTFQGRLSSGAPNPFTVDWHAGCPIAVVAMIDRTFIEDTVWVEHLHDLGKHAATQGPGARLLPVSMEPGVLDDLNLVQQALRWDERDSAKDQRLIRELACEFARMLRGRLHVLRQPSAEPLGLGDHLEKIQTFLSHTKWDKNGREISETIRCWLHQNSALASFLDVYDIPGGLPFSDVIHHHIGRSVFLVIHTDHYSSREWCRREVLEAKRKGVPMIVVDCLLTGEERAFPYLGNVPIIRMDPVTQNRLPEIAGRLLDEVLVDFLWRCRVEGLTERPTGTIFMARPPELVSLATLAINHETQGVVVYPDPPLGKEETQLIEETWSGLRIQTMTQWLTKETP